MSEIKDYISNAKGFSSSVEYQGDVEKLREMFCVPVKSIYDIDVVGFTDKLTKTNRYYVAADKLMEVLTDIHIGTYSGKYATGHHDAIVAMREAIEKFMPGDLT